MNIKKHTPPPVQTTYDVLTLTDDEISLIRLALYTVGANHNGDFDSDRISMAQRLHKAVWRAQYDSNYDAAYL